MTQGGSLPLPRAGLFGAATFLIAVRFRCMGLRQLRTVLLGTSLSLATLVACAAALAPLAGAATTPSPLDWKLGRPSSFGTTVVGLMPGQGSTRRLGVSVHGRPAVAIAGLHAISMRATPHVGTDTDGSVVVVYPRCATAAGARCDLYQAGVSGGAERRVAGVNTSGSSELQGAIDRGSVAFLRSRDSRGGFYAEHVSLYRRPADGKAGLVTRAGGSAIALSGTHIAQVRDIDPGVALCGMPSVEILDATGALRRVKSTMCGLNGQSFGSLNFWGGKLLFLAFNGADGPARTTIYRTALHSSVLTHASGPLNAVAFAPTGARSGVALLDDEWTEPPTSTMVRIGQLPFRAP